MGWPYSLSVLVLSLLASASALGRTPDDFALMLDVAERGGQLVAVGERGLVLRSDNLGRSWQVEATPTRALLTCIATGPDGRWWAGGHDGVLLVANSKASGWAPAPGSSLTPTDALFGIHFSTTGEARLWGAFGLLVRLPAQGPAERLVSPAGDVHFYAGVEHAGDGWLFGEAGSAVRWGQEGPQVEALVDDAPSLHGALALQDGTVLAYGLRGRLLRLKADGPWEECETGARNLLSAGVELRPGVIVLAGQSGAWRLSTDGAQTWSEMPSPVEGGVSKLLLLSDGALLVAGENGLRRLEKDRLP